MPSSMPRLLAGPCLSAIFPAFSSIFLTSPLMSCAAAAVTIVTASIAAPAMLINLFIAGSPFGLNFCSSFYNNTTRHAVFSVVWDQTGIFECSCLGKFPKDLGGLFRRYAHAVWIVVLHMRVLLHELLVF